MLSLAPGYWLKQYHEEMQEGLRLVKGSMNMLGAPEDEEAANAKEEELWSGGGQASSYLASISFASLLS